jgi:hypothetical protein
VLWYIDLLKRRMVDGYGLILDLRTTEVSCARQPGDSTPSPWSMRLPLCIARDSTIIAMDYSICTVFE